MGSDWIGNVALIYTVVKTYKLDICLAIWLDAQSIVLREKTKKQVIVYVYPNQNSKCIKVNDIRMHTIN